MTGDASRDEVGCHEAACESVASFRLYDPTRAGWVPVCEQHALAVHPSLEIGALLESGYLRPVELGPPDGPPTAPVTPRGEMFRETVEELLGWSVQDG